MTNILNNNDFEKRLLELRKIIKRKNLDGIIIYSDEYRSGYCTYFTGYKPINVIEESPQTLILIKDNDPILVVGRLNYYSAKETVWIKNILQHNKFETEIFEILKKNNKKNLAIGLAGEHLMPFYLRDLISEAMPDVNFSIQTSILNDLRKIKTEKEVKLMKQAAKINDQVLRQLRDEIQIGMTEQQVVAYADFFGRKLGADLGSATVVMSGYNTKFPAWRATNKEINKGEFVMVDFNPTIENYCNDGGVTFLMSGASKKKIEALEMSHQFLKEVIKNIKANNKASSIHDQFYNLLKPTGFEPSFSPYVSGTRGLGHGVGLDVVEAPDLSKISDFILEAGMTLAIKLDLHDVENSGLRVEQVVLVTDSGSNSLNQLVLEEKNDWAILK
jgi:Xaa-Pro aminopeptidase